MMKSLRTTLFILAVFVPLILLADGAKTLFQHATEEYEKQNYDSSITLLDSLLDAGLESPELYYNLGNAWFKLGEVPKAILYYEKARKLAPNDPDIIYNLELANTRIADKIEPVPEFFLKKWWKRAINFFTEEQWMLINVFSFGLMLVFAVIFFVAHTKGSKQLGFYLGIIFLFISLMTGLMGYSNYKNLNTHNSAIVFTPTVNVKSSPTDGANTIFVIHQGTKVELIDQVKDWYRIKLANGSVGWIKAEDFEKI
jgi:hypothetical protein